LTVLEREIGAVILIYELFQRLREKKETLSVAESCTGGSLAYEISKLSGSSSIFLGGIIAYANTAKEQILQIPKELLLEQGAVSEDVALLMAEHCKKLFSSSWAISTTGFSGPSGGSVENPVGTVYIGLSGPKVRLVNRYCFQNLSRLEHRQKTVHQVLLLLLAQYNIK
jgi:PncC family amidohydrolase